MRSREALESALRAVMLDLKIGKVLVQPDPETKQRRLLYSKLPKDVTKNFVMLLDPILASGSTAIAAIKHLLEVYCEILLVTHNHFSLNSSRLFFIALISV